MEKRFILNEYGEAVRVTEEEYLKWKEENPEQNANIPTFKTPNQQDVQKEDSERLADDKKIFKTPQQEPTLDDKESKINRIVDMLKQLDLSEEKLLEIENEAKRDTDTNIKDEKEKEDGR